MGEKKEVALKVEDKKADDTKIEDKKVVDKKDISKKINDPKEDGRRTITIEELRCRACNSRQVYTLISGKIVCRRCSFRDDSMMFDEYKVKKEKE